MVIIAFPVRNDVHVIAYPRYTIHSQDIQF